MQSLEPGQQYRCSACGGRTRFDVTRTIRRRDYYHFTVGGDLTIEDPQVLEETVERVSCRWCGHGNAIEVIGVMEGANTD